MIIKCSSNSASSMIHGIHSTGVWLNIIISVQYLYISCHENSPVFFVVTHDVCYIELSWLFCVFVYADSACIFSHLQFVVLLSYQYLCFVVFAGCLLCHFLFPSPCVTVIWGSHIPFFAHLCVLYTNVSFYSIATLLA